MKLHLTKSTKGMEGSLKKDRVLSHALFVRIGSVVFFFLFMCSCLAIGVAQGLGGASFTISKTQGQILIQDEMWAIQPPLFIPVGEEQNDLSFKVRSNEEALFVLLDYWVSEEEAAKQAPVFHVSCDQNSKDSEYFGLEFPLKESVLEFRKWSSKEGETQAYEFQTEAKPEVRVWRDKSDRVKILIRLPFAAFSIPTPQHGDVWHFNVGANYQSAESLPRIWKAWVNPSDPISPSTIPALGTIAFE